jgi:hypothetical protein
VFTTTLKAQTIEESDVIEPVLTIDSTYTDPLFIQYPYLRHVSNFDEYGNAKQLQRDYMTFDNVWDYQKKFYRQIVVGSGIGAIAIAGMVKTVNMPTPTRQVNNPALNPAADEARRDRRIWGAASIGVGIISGIIIYDAFKWQKRIHAEVGLQSARLEYRLTGNRPYFSGKEYKKMKKLGIYPRYRQ